MRTMQRRCGLFDFGATWIVDTLTYLFPNLVYEQKLTGSHLRLMICSIVNRHP